jgi:Fe-S-cluster containining protein
VEVSVEDLVRMELATEDEAQGSLKKLGRRLEREGHVQYFRVASGLFLLTQRPNGDCRYLDANRHCTIYDRRPDVCRKFPTELGPRVGYCPKNNWSGNS